MRCGGSLVQACLFAPPQAAARSAALTQPSDIAKWVRDAKRFHLMKILHGSALLALATMVLAAGEDRTRQLMSSLERDPAFKVRLQAAVLLGRSKDQRAIKALVSALRDEHYTVRGAACLGLGNLEAVEASPALIQVAATDEEAYVRKEAKGALGRFDKERLWPHVLQASNSSDVEVRREAITLASEWQDDRARLRLVEALDDAEPIVRIVDETLAALGPSAKAELLRLGLDSQRPIVRVKAAELLGALGSEKAVAILMDTYEQELDSDELRRSVREQLRKLRSRLPMQDLERDAAPGHERFSRARALKFLGVAGGPGAFQILLGALRDEDVYVRGVAALALGDLGDPKAIPALEQLIASADNARIVPIVRNTIRILERKLGP